MELHSEDPVSRDGDGHHIPAGVHGIDVQRQGGTVGAEGVVPHSLEVVRDTFEKLCPVVMDLYELPVHRTLSPDDFRAMVGADRLMAEADPERRDVVVAPVVDPPGAPVRMRMTRSGREDDGIGGDDLFIGHGVLRNREDLCTQ